MKAEILNFTYLNAREGVLTVKLESDFREQFDRLNGKPVDVKINLYKDKRSLDANAYAWAMIHKIAYVIREEPVITYRKLIRDFSCKTKVTCVKAEDMESEIQEFTQGHFGRMVDIGDSRFPGYVVLHKKYGSSSFDTAQMSAFIEIIQNQCRELGIETEDPNKIKSMLEEWK